MRPIELVLQALADHKVKATGRGRWSARCPGHEDRSPSLSIHETDDGKVLLHCFAGCGIDRIVGGMGLALDDLFPDRAEFSPGSRRTVTYKAALEAIKAEALLVVVAANNLAGGYGLTPQDLDRLRVAAQRIQAAAESAGV